MTSSVDSKDLERRKQVRVRVRRDLEITPQRYEGRTYYVVKDPVSLRYWRFKDKEEFLISRMDGKRTLDQAQKEFEQRFRPDRLSLEDLEAFAQQLMNAGLAFKDSPTTGKQLYESRTKRRRQEWTQRLTNILYIKIPVFDPDRLLTAMLPYTRWIFTTWFLTLSVLFIFSAILLVATHFQTFRDKLPSYQEFFSFKNLIYMWAALGVVKVIHEFGHGLSCKAFGGEVHEMGFLLLCLSPAMYCNVSDSWTLPNKWHRILISAAGIYVELVIAAIATFVWWNTPSHPFVNNLALSIMVVCSVSTVVFNGNPLMRYDGYYVLADWIEIPNLRIRANRYLMRLVQEHCLGIEVPPEPHMELWRQVLFVAYAVVSYLYRWIITFSILYFLYVFLKPYKLGAISGLLALAAAGSMAGWPLYHLAKNLRKRGRLPDMKPLRLTISAAFLTALVLGFFLVPLPVSRVRQYGLVQVVPTAEEKVYLVGTGILERLDVLDGQFVHRDDILAEFKNLDLDSQYEEARTQLAIRIAQWRNAEELAREARDESDRSRYLTEIARAKGERDLYASQVEKYAKMKNELILRAPRDGIVMSCPRRDEIGKLWDKERTEPFCSVGEPRRTSVLLPVSTADYELLSKDLAHARAQGRDLDVDIRVQGLGARVWKGRILYLPQSEAKEIPLALTVKAGGPVATKPSTNPNQHVPQSQQFLVPIEILGADASICPGAMAQVKVHCRWKTAAWWTWRAISSTFDLGLI
jgi:putative peptide zinc metalloprotease protein